MDKKFLRTCVVLALTSNSISALSPDIVQAEFSGTTCPGGYYLYNQANVTINGTLKSCTGYPTSNNAAQSACYQYALKTGLPLNTLDCGTAPTLYTCPKAGSDDIVI